MERNGLIGGGRMRRSSWIILLILCLSLRLMAQDPVHKKAPLGSELIPVDSLRRYGHIAERVALPDYPAPGNFRLVQENILSDPYRELDVFWQKLAETTFRTSADTVRIVHVGDSHVRGHVFPLTTGEELQQCFAKLVYEDDGINGATNLTFSTPQRVQEIVSRKPDMLILSFGTNESHGRGYNELRHYEQMTDFLNMLREQLPEVPILLTTPPGSFERGGTRRRRTYKVNPRTQLAVVNIKRFATQYRLAVWDLYNIFGGADRACLNWEEAGLMRPDHVHYLPEGYALQGRWLAQAMLKAYNAYVESD